MYQKCRRILWSNSDEYSVVESFYGDTTDGGREGVQQREGVVCLPSCDKIEIALTGMFNFFAYSTSIAFASLASGLIFLFLRFIVFYTLFATKNVNIYTISLFYAYIRDMINDLSHELTPSLISRSPIHTDPLNICFLFILNIAHLPHTSDRTTHVRPRAALV